MLVTLKTHKHIYDVTNMIILFNVFFWIKLLLKLPKYLTQCIIKQKESNPKITCMQRIEAKPNPRWLP